MNRSGKAKEREQSREDNRERENRMGERRAALRTLIVIRLVACAPDPSLSVRVLARRAHSHAFDVVFTQEHTDYCRRRRKRGAMRRRRDTQL